MENYSFNIKLRIQPDRLDSKKQTGAEENKTIIEQNELMTVIAQKLLPVIEKELSLLKERKDFVNHRLIYDSKIIE